MYATKTSKYKITVSHLYLIPKQIESDTNSLEVLYYFK